MAWPQTMQSQHSHSHLEAVITASQVLRYDDTTFCTCLRLLGSSFRRLPLQRSFVRELASTKRPA